MLYWGGVCSFEIKLDEIAGLDYWNPLLVDASRVVIEAGDGWRLGWKFRASFANRKMRDWRVPLVAMAKNLQELLRHREDYPMMIQRPWFVPVGTSQSWAPTMVYVRESNPPLHSGYPGTRYAHPGIKIQLSFNHTNHVLPISPICLGCNHAQKIRNWNDPPLPVLVYEHRYKCKSSILYIYIYILCIYIYVYIYIYIYIYVCFHMCSMIITISKSKHRIWGWPLPGSQPDPALVPRPRRVPCALRLAEGSDADVPTAGSQGGLHHGQGAGNPKIPWKIWKLKMERRWFAEWRKMISLK